MSKPREYTLCECTGERATDRGMNIAQSMTGTFLTLEKEMFPEGTISSVLHAIGPTRSGTAQILIIRNYITKNPTQRMLKNTKNNLIIICTICHDEIHHKSRRQYRPECVPSLRVARQRASTVCEVAPKTAGRCSICRNGNTHLVVRDKTWCYKMKA